MEKKASFPTQRESPRLVVDIGSGIRPLHLINGLRPPLKDGEFYIGIDLEHDRLKAGRTELREFYRCNKDFFVRASGENMPLREESADEIWINNVFSNGSQHDVRKFLLEATKILKKGGRIFINELITPNHFYKNVPRGDIDKLIEELPLRIEKYELDYDDTFSLPDEREEMLVTGIKIVLIKE